MATVVHLRLLQLLHIAATAKTKTVAATVAETIAAAAARAPSLL